MQLIFIELQYIVTLHKLLQVVVVVILYTLYTECMSLFFLLPDGPTNLLDELLIPGHLQSGKCCPQEAYQTRTECNEP